MYRSDLYARRAVLTNLQVVIAQPGDVAASQVVTPAVTSGTYAAYYDPATNYSCGTSALDDHMTTLSATSAWPGLVYVASGGEYRYELLRGEWSGTSRADQSWSYVPTDGDYALRSPGAATVTVTRALARRVAVAMYYRPVWTQDAYTASWTVYSNAAVRKCWGDAGQCPATGPEYTGSGTYTLSLTGTASAAAGGVSNAAYGAWLAPYDDGDDGGSGGIGAWQWMDSTGVVAYVAPYWRAKGIPYAETGQYLDLDLGYDFCGVFPDAVVARLRRGFWPTIRWDADGAFMLLRYRFHLR
jgi:hypothetical protein